MDADGDWRLLAEFILSSDQGNERLAMEQVAAVAAENGLGPNLIDRLKTAVAETTMNAIEHGNKFSPDLTVKVEVFRSVNSLMVRITDHGGGKEIPTPVIPDLEAKLDGLQSPRGWGLFLIENMVDEMRVHSDARHHIVELILRLEAKHE